MDFINIVDISQGSLDIMNPTTPDKVISAGRKAGMKAGDRVVEFGCGNGTILTLWADEFGVFGTGIDIRGSACRSAENAAKKSGSDKKITIINADASTFTPGDTPYDFAACIGSSQIWGGFKEAIDAMSAFLTDEGGIIIGERYWKTDRVSPEFAREWPEILTEYEILGIIRDAGFELGSVIRADADDWDRYESAIWKACSGWLRDNADHPEADEIRDYLHTIQDEY
ncbi:MAG: methyltransferase domain-containing protein, partial [Methanogenium sp.]|nr:methyltransferase domain-containing protein [Methanogenium sp.]